MFKPKAGRKFKVGDKVATFTPQDEERLTEAAMKHALSRASVVDIAGCVGVVVAKHPNDPRYRVLFRRGERNSVEWNVHPDFLFKVG